MKISAAYELQSLAAAVAAGVAFGIIYDLAKSFRRALGKNALPDALMWTAVTALSVGIWYEFQNGEIRWYMVVGAFSAAILYFLLISRAVFCVFSFLAEKICRFFELISKILLTPIKFLCKIIGVYKKKAEQKSLMKAEDEKYGKKADF